jgi:GNAT superfamily N-acetyltransferase
VPSVVLPVPGQRVAALEEQCRAHAVGYRLVRWRDRVPDDLVEGRADLSRRMSTDVPLGELDWHEERWDAARVRRDEELVAKQGRTTVAAGAVHEATGELVAYTDVALDPARAERVFQWSTIVRDDHRGHRLGMLVKLEVLRQLGEQFPQARYISTWNAATNQHMIAVNEALGFERNGQLVSFQREV